MSERSTPRTDSAIMEIPSKFDSICVVRVELALDLERELGEALRERDEARKAYDTLATEHVLAVNKLAEERDEAREALDCLLAVIGLTPIAGNREALQEVVDQGLLVLRKLEETK